MADKKITQLDPITGANLADTDEFVVVDLSADETKSITFAELKNGFDTTTGFVRITGDTMTGNLSFGDNNKIIMGAGSDLQLYHDGSNSYVSDQGTGQLVLLSNSFRLNNAANSENIITAEENGAVSLFFNDSSKLATTATGVDISGGFTATDGSSITTADNTVQLTLISTDADASVGPQLELYRNSGSPADSDTLGFVTFKGRNDNSQDVVYAGLQSYILDASDGTEDGYLVIDTMVAGTARERISIDSTTTVFNEEGEDIDFRVESDNSANALFVEGSSGNVGIGTSSPNAYSGYTSLTLDNATNGGIIDIERNGTLVGEMFTTDANTFSLAAVGAKAMNFSTNSAERMRLDSSGRLLVAKTTTAFGTVGHTIWNDGSHDLTASAIPPIQANRLTSDGDIVAFYKTSSKVGSIGNSGTNFIIQQSNASGVVQIKNHDSTEDIEFGQDYFRIKQGGAERFKIDSSGNLIKNGGGLISSNGTGDTLVISGSNAVNTGGNITLEGNTASDVSQIKFKNGSTEVMRIASGYLYMGTTAEPSASQTGVRISGTNGQNFWKSSNSGTSGYDQLAFFNGNGLVGTISTSGSATAYNTSSDYRLKTDAQPMTGASERVQALNPVNFEWVADGTRVDGFLAHEAQVVVPESVTGTKDAVDADGNPEYQGIDQSKLVPLLTAALQEALTEITTLKARVTALEGA